MRCEDCGDGKVPTHKQANQRAGRQAGRHANKLDRWKVGRRPATGPKPSSPASWHCRWAAELLMWPLLSLLITGFPVTSPEDGGREGGCIGLHLVRGSPALGLASPQKPCSFPPLPKVPTKLLLFSFIFIVLVKKAGSFW